MICEQLFNKWVKVIRKYDFVYLPVIYTYIAYFSYCLKLRVRTFFILNKFLFFK